MQTVFKSNPRKLYTGADTNGKKLLEELFGADYLTTDICDLVNSFEDACDLTGDNPTDAKFVSLADTRITAFYQLETICKALNEGVELSYENTEQQKWYPVLEYVKGKGFRFWLAFYDVADAHAPGGSALCVKNERLAIHLANKFLPLLIQFHTKPK